jgi:glycosyltransferase involved in cell wall biosynthesis
MTGDVTSPSSKLDYGAILPGVGVFGGVRRFIEIGNELVRRGHRFVLYHPSGERPSWLPFAGVTRPLEALDSARHDVLLCNDPPMLYWFDRAIARRKFFYCVLEKLQDEKRILTNPEWTILANSTGIQKRIHKKYGVRAAPVIGGLDARVFRARTDVRPNDGPFRILAYGRVSRRAKGVPLVVKAVEDFARDIASKRAVQLVLFDAIGPGNERDPRDQVKSRVPIDYQLNLSQPDLAALYGSCHVFVSAERKAGWSNTVAEAMACGLPVVCTRSGTLDLAIHKRTAWTTHWRHPWFLKRGVRALFDDETLADALRRAAQEHVQQFAWPYVVDQLEAVVGRSGGTA